MNRAGKSNAAVFDVARQCVDNINFHRKQGWDVQDAAVLITTPPKWKAPPKFPRGEIVQVKEDGTRIRHLPAMRLLAWFCGNGLIKPIFEDRKDFAIEETKK
jgi:hypothetical protein